MKTFFKTTLFVCLFFPSNFIYSNGIGIIDGLAGIYLSVIESEVVVEVNNQIAVVTSKQTFRNDTGAPIVFKYGFPLDQDANPISLRWFADGIWDEATVSGDNQNNDIPGTGGSGGAIDPNLEAYLGTSPLLFNFLDTLPADSSIIFELTYVQLLPYFLGVVSFEFPNNLSTLQSTLLERQYFHFTLISDREILAIVLVDVNSTDNVEPNLATLENELLNEGANFNYLVNYELSSDGLGVFPLSTVVPDSLLYCDDFGEGFISLIIEPESNVNTDVIEKNFTLVIDRSGSMGGEKIIQAREAASFIVNNLNPGDYFNIIDFSSDVSSLFPSHVEYTTSNQIEALNYIMSIDAGGSTNIEGSLVTATSQFQGVDPEKANIILFFTDGNATAGITSTPGILDAVSDQVAQSETSIFLFTFGIGEDVNKPLLILLAQQNNGLTQFIEEEDLQISLSEFFLSINNPVLINTAITFDPPIIEQLYPNPLPNLYKGQQLIISGRYAESGTVNMHMEGQAFNLPVEFDFEFSLSDSLDPALSFLPKIWAKQKIDALSLDYFLAETVEMADTIQSEVDSTSVCYGVVSVDFSSFSDPGGNQTVETDEVFQIPGDLNILVSPNPFTDQIQIIFETPNNLNEEIIIELVDVQGRLINQIISELEGNQFNVLIPGLDYLAHAVYFCRIKIGAEVIVFKLIKV